jgi:hypothetical protein
MPRPPFAPGRNVYFNAPAMVQADISEYPGAYNSDGYTPTKQDRALVIARKGWLTPDVMFFKDWEVDSSTTTEEDGELAGEDKSATEINLQKLFPSNEQYGFRFMYNPPAIAFSLGIPGGVNAQFVMSGADKSTPQVPTGSTISLNLTISRVDDIAFIYGTDGHRPRSDLGSVLKDYGYWQTNAPGEPHKDQITGLRPPYAEATDAQNTSYNIRTETRAVLAQVKEIARLGTMHDMNYLFRSMIARDIQTTYRGTTADIGIGFSVPMALNLGNDNMMYRVRLGSLNYTHKQFHPSMIPTITDVALSLERIPDSINWTGTAATINRG